MRSNRWWLSTWWLSLCAAALVAACAAGIGAQGGSSAQAASRSGAPAGSSAQPRSSAQAGSSAAPAAGANAIAAQIAEGKAAAGDTWMGLFSEMCGGAMGAGGRASSILPRADTDQATGRGSGRQAGPPPRERWYHDPVKMFDNMYGFSTDDVMAMAITTSAGIILVDATYDYSVKDLIVDAMPKVGLDPAQIKYAVITHGHGDHFAGAKYLQDHYGTKIAMSDTDWSLVARPPRAGGLPAGPLAHKDLIVTDGQKLTLGDTTITLYSTPGHTAGTTSMIIPVKDHGVTHYAALWGGTSISTSSPYDMLVAYTSSARRMRDLAARAGADVILSPHGRVIDFFKRANSVNLLPTGANPFIEGQAEVKNFFDMADHCSQAVTMAQATAKK